MSRAHTNRVSRSVVVAGACIVIASAGTAVATKAITSSDIQNGTIRLADLSKSARAKLAGVPGPPGAIGPEGPQGESGAPEPWKPLPLAATWSNLGGTFEGGGYRIDPTTGRVDLRGVVTSSDIPFGSVIATLPAGYRPQHTQIFAVATGETFAAGRIDIGASGTITRLFGNIGEQDYTSLSGISFYTD